jgi:hypothetical protein
MESEEAGLWFYGKEHNTQEETNKPQREKAQKLK